MFEDLTPEQLAESRRLAEGPLGDFISKYPLMFATSALITWNEDGRRDVLMNNGTITLLRLGGRQFGVTCDHVIQKYIDTAARWPSTVFQAGNQRVNLPDWIVDRNAALDLAVLDLTGRAPTANTHPEIGNGFFEPRDWPPALPKVGNVVEIGGFPGAFRERTGPDSLRFGTFSVGKTPVASVSPARLAIQLEREYWMDHPGAQSGLQFRSLPGVHTS